MRKKVKNPYQHIISFRINDQERKTLDNWAMERGMSISSTLRDIISQMTSSFENQQQQD